MIVSLLMAACVYTPVPPSVRARLAAPICCVADGPQQHCAEAPAAASAKPSGRRLGGKTEVELNPPVPSSAPAQSPVRTLGLAVGALVLALALLSSLRGGGGGSDLYYYSSSVSTSSVTRLDEGGRPVVETRTQRSERTNLKGLDMARDGQADADADAVARSLLFPF